MAGVTPYHKLGDVSANRQIQRDVVLYIRDLPKLHWSVIVKITRARHATACGKSHD